MKKKKREVAYMGSVSKLAVSAETGKMEVMKGKGEYHNNTNSVILCDRKYLTDKACRAMGIEKVRTAGSNTFYKKGDVALVEVVKQKREPKRTLFLYIIMDARVGGMEIEEIFRGKNIILRGNRRLIPIVSVETVWHRSGKERVQGNKYPINVCHIMHAIHKGEVTVPVAEIKEFDIYDKEAHHEKFNHDHRIASTKILSKKQHKEESFESHYCECFVYDDKDLKELFNYYNEN